MGAITDQMRIKAKDKLIWEPVALTPPLIYVRILQVRRHGSCVAAECWQETSPGVIKHWKRPFSLPLPTSMRREDWVFSDSGQPTRLEKEEKSA